MGRCSNEQQFPVNWEQNTRQRCESRQQGDTGCTLSGHQGEKRRAVQLCLIDQSNELLAEGQACSHAFSQAFTSADFRVAAHGCSLD